MKIPEKGTESIHEELERLRTRVAELEAQQAGTIRSSGGLPKSEDIFTAIFLNSSDVQLIIDDKSGTIMRANKAVRIVLQYNEDDLVGKHLSVLYPPERETPREESLARINVYGPVLEGQRLLRADGTLFPAELTATLIPWGDGEAILATFRDVSERVQAQKALRESEEKYRTLAELLPGIVFEIDVNRDFSFINQCGLEALGYRSEELIGNGNSLNVVVPRDRDRLARDVERVFEGESLAGNEYRSLRKDGSSFPVALYASPLIHDDQIVGFRGVGVDITELKRTQEALEAAKKTLESRVAERTAELAQSNEQLRLEVAERTRTQKALMNSEQRARAVFDTAIDCIFIKDKSLKYTLVNPAMEQLLGLPADEIIGCTDSQLFGEEEGEHLKAVDDRVLAGESIEEEHTRPVKGGLITFLDVRAPMRDDRGAIVGVCGISRNITERSKTLIPGRHDGPDFPSKAMNATLNQALMAAQSETMTLLTGESGSGKDYLARVIHDRSKRSSGPFYTINCAALPPELAESELFGHEPGAFTGANRVKRGLLELAEGGTLLMNEIGELSLGMQAKLLTFMDTKAFTRVGGEKTVTVNARLIAATNRDLEKEVSEGRFRADLFYRLNVLRIRVPPLRERMDDIPILVSEILTLISTELQLAGTPQVDSANMAILTKYSWPGNVRELRNVLERALIVSRSGHLRFDSLAVIENESRDWAWKTTFPPHLPFNDLIKNLKRSIIEEALERTGGRKKEAARLLGITRHVLRRQIEASGLGNGDKQKSS